MCLWRSGRAVDTQKPTTPLLLALDNLIYLWSQSSAKRRTENRLGEVRNVFRYSLAK
jgi:hypothetical protein